MDSEETEDSRIPRRRCAVCGKATNRKKPLCSEHVLHMPYAGRVAREVEERTREGERAALGHWREVDPEGSRAREVLELLETFACLPMGELARLVCVEIVAGRRLKAARAYVRALESRGLVETVTSVDSQSRVRKVVRIRRTPAVPAAAPASVERAASGA